MVNKKYAGEKDIREKIEALFSYRKLTGLLQQAELEKENGFNERLINVQYQIYLLDAYLESQWVLEKKQLKSCWKAIRESLAELNYTSAQTDSRLQEIKMYERIERNCRKGKWPTGVSFKKFYTTKSCDVRLMRHIIYDASPDLKTVWKEKNWVYYDLITEINDDIADVREDLATYNGNRFLISLLRKGILKTEKQYRAYLLKITDKAKSYFQKHEAKGANPQLLAWTLERSAETLLLLQDIIEQSDPSIYSSSLMLEKMK